MLVISCMAINFVACDSNTKEKEGSAESINTVEIPERANFTQAVDSKEVDLYVLKNSKNMQVVITNYGARIVSLVVPNKHQTFSDVVLGYDNLNDYVTAAQPYFGAIIGRYCNRIANGKFALDGKIYQLEKNEGPNSLHGGKNGFHTKVWSAYQSRDNVIELRYTSEDGEAGYPGNLNVKVIYTLTDENALHMEYAATTDRKTIINLTNHAYFNLNGEGDSTILDHEIMINANTITPINNLFIPTGVLMAVEGTPFDFRKFATIGARINEDNEQLKNGNGYDHNWVLNKSKGLRVVATVRSPKTGIVMDLITEKPGLQFYTGNFLNDNIGKGGKVYKFRSAFCLETQHFPDSPNQPTFPKTILKPGQIYESTTIYRFSVK